MTISAVRAAPSTAGVIRRDHLKTALERRRVELTAALGLYEEIAVSTAPRVALIRRTRHALHDIDIALRHLHDADYGTCRSCHRPLRTTTLALYPLAGRCPNCTPLDAA